MTFDCCVNSYRLLYCWFFLSGSSLRFYYYQWVDTSAGILLVPEYINRPVVSALSLTWLIRYIYA